MKHNTALDSYKASRRVFLALHGYFNQGDCLTSIQRLSSEIRLYFGSAVFVDLTIAEIALTTGLKESFITEMPLGIQYVHATPLSDIASEAIKPPAHIEATIANLLKGKYEPTRTSKTR